MAKQTTPPLQKWLEAWFNGKKPSKTINLLEKIRYDHANAPLLIQAKNLKEVQSVLLKHMVEPALYALHLEHVCSGCFRDEDFGALLDELGLEPDRVGESPAALATLRDGIAQRGGDFLSSRLEYWEDSDSEGAASGLNVMTRDHFIGAVGDSSFEQANAAERAAMLVEGLAHDTYQAHYAYDDHGVRLFVRHHQVSLREAALSDAIWPGQCPLLIRAHMNRYHDELRCSDDYPALFDAVEASLGALVGVSANLDDFIEAFEEWDDDMMLDALDALDDEPHALKQLYAVYKDHSATLFEPGGRSHFFLKGDYISPLTLARPCAMLVLS